MDSNKEIPKTIWFNYSQENLKILDNKDMKDEYNYEVVFPEINGYQKLTIGELSVYFSFTGGKIN